MTDLPTPGAILDFWIGPASDDSIAAEKKHQLWFQKSDQTDTQIRQLFLPVLETIAGGQLTDWTSGQPRSQLAAIIVLDQFSRNLFRGEARAFAQDAQALSLAKGIVAAGNDKSLTEIERMFVYLPYEHSEALSDQARSVALCTALLEDARPSFRSLCGGTLDYAQQHYDVIAKYGRFPHRNAALGRTSTSEEQAYLAKPGAGF